MLDEWGASTDSDLLLWPMYERCRGLLAAGRGDVDDARKWAGRAVALAETTGVRWDWLEATRALGVAALLAKDASEAVEHLGAVWEHTQREGVLDPGTFPAGPDLVEALVETQAYDAARDVVAVLARLAEAQDHPWARARRRARRRDLVLAVAADGDDTSAAWAALEAAAAAYRELGLGFDEARTLLTLGRARSPGQAVGSGARACSSAPWRRSRRSVRRGGPRTPAPSWSGSGRAGRAAPVG